MQMKAESYRDVWFHCVRGCAGTLMILWNKAAFGRERDVIAKTVREALIKFVTYGKFCRLTICRLSVNFSRSIEVNDIG